MSTRGSIEIGNSYLYIRSDAYPEYANKVLAKTLAQKPKDVHAFIRTANRIAGFEWVYSNTGGSDYKDSIFEEYRYIVNLHSHTFHLDQSHRTRHIEGVRSDLSSRGFILDKHGRIVGHDNKTDPLTKKRR